MPIIKSIKKNYNNKLKKMLIKNSFRNIFNCYHLLRGDVHELNILFTFNLNKFMVSFARVVINFHKTT